MTRGSRSARLGALCAGALLLTGIAACGGGGSSSGGTPPSGLSYATSPGLYRMSETIAPNVPAVTGTVVGYSVTPALPAGLDLDATTGAISGTPTEERAAIDYTITAANDDGTTSTSLSIDVAKQLPSAITALPLGFEATEYATASKIAKVEMAEDGRLFFTEVDNGRICFVPASGNGVVIFATLPVLQGGHQGLLGMALDPQFGTNGFIYITACIAGDGMTTSDRQQLIRYTDSNGTGTNMTVMLDDLPICVTSSQINNGGELLFDDDGALLMSLGDVDVPSNAQAPTSTTLAGKVLRFDVSGDTATVPVSNPFAGDPEFANGLRNCFGLAKHPTFGTIWCVDNGPDANDELNLLSAGRNYKAGGTPTGPETRDPIRNYPDVITPTAICWHDGTGWGSDYADNMFMSSYTDSNVRRLELSSGNGGSPADIDAETIFCTLSTVGGDPNKPLDVCIDPANGDMYIATLAGILRIQAQ